MASLQASDQNQLNRPRGVLGIVNHSGQPNKRSNPNSRMQINSTPKKNLTCFSDGGRLTHLAMRRKCLGLNMGYSVKRTLPI